MTANLDRNLGIVSLTTLLVSAHYGLGFILGTAEQSLYHGSAGSLYAIALGLGTIGLALLAKLYWNRIAPIWTLLGDCYGPPVKIGIGIMSWLSLIGIEAVQIISAAAILEVAGLPKLATMVGIAAAFFFLSLVPIERASTVFRILLLLNFGALLFASGKLASGGVYGQLLTELPVSVAALPQADTAGILLPTMLLVAIDMKCQQFVVRARSLRAAVCSCLLAGGIFIVLAFLPAAIVIASQQRGILPDTVSAKAAIPFILSWMGGGTEQPLGIVLLGVLALPALGLGSNVLRVQTRTNLDLVDRAESRSYRIAFALFNAVFGLGIALRGGEIVDLIVCFYAAYLSAVWVPLIAYMCEQAQWLTFSKRSVQVALATGAIAAAVALGLGLFAPEWVWFDRIELGIMVLGFVSGGVSLVVAQAIATFWILLRPVQEDFDT